jgi:tRNA (cytidine/uridine-2'-O-)-methyltransferase
MDYWHSLDVCHHASWDAFAQSPQAPQRLWLFTTRAQRSFWQADFQPHDGLVFGNEGHGAPDWLHERLADFRLRIPHRVPGYRSLNLSTSVGIALYEALRQTEPAAGS